MLDVLVEHARAANILILKGFYLPTKKNGMVADHYERLGFTRVSLDPETNASAWSLDVASYAARNRHIRILELIHG